MNRTAFHAAFASTLLAASVVGAQPAAEAVPAAGIPQQGPEPGPGPQPEPSPGPQPGPQPPPAPAPDAATATVPATDTAPDTAAVAVPAPAPAPAPVPAPPPPPPAPAAPAPPPPPPSRSLETGVTLGAGIALGVLNLPNLGAAPTVWGQLTTEGGWAFELSLDWWLDNHAVLGIAERDLVVHPIYIVPYPPGGSRVVFQAVEAAFAVCPHRIVLSPGELALCAGVRGGVLRADAEGLLDAEQATRALFAFAAHARWHYRLGGPIGLSYSAGLFVPVLRDHFIYVDSAGAEREKFRPAPVGGRLDLALTYSF